MPLTPGARVTLPIFESADATHTSEETFRLSWVIIRLGETTTSGHYQVALSVPNPRTNTWEFHICDDDRVPRKSS